MTSIKFKRRPQSRSLNPTIRDYAEMELRIQHIDYNRTAKMNGKVKLTLQQYIMSNEMRKAFTDDYVKRYCKRCAFFSKSKYNNNKPVIL